MRLRSIELLEPADSAFIGELDRLRTLTSANISSINRLTQMRDPVFTLSYGERHTRRKGPQLGIW
jgi:hypothetical protein